MTNKTWLLLAFGLMAALQLWLPARTAYRLERVLRQGEVFHFAAGPVDPNDPFRGKYLVLDIPNLDAIPWDLARPIIDGVADGDELFLVIGKDSLGFAKIGGVETSAPTGQPYMKATVDYVYNDTSMVNPIVLRNPLNRFYLDEHQAPVAEERFNQRGVGSTAFAKVRVLNGLAVLEDVIVGEESVRLSKE